MIGELRCRSGSRGKERDAPKEMEWSLSPATSKPATSTPVVIEARPVRTYAAAVIGGSPEAADKKNREERGERREREGRRGGR